MVAYRKVYDLKDNKKLKYNKERFLTIFRSMRNPVILIDDTLEDNNCKLILQNKGGVIRYDLIGECNEIFEILEDIEDSLFENYRISKG